MRGTVLALGFMVVALSATAADPWPKFARDDRNSGRSDRSSQPNARLRWTASGSQAVAASPIVIAGGGVVFASSDGKVTALDARGRKQWSTSLGSSIFAAPSRLGDGYAVATCDGHLVELTSAGSIRHDNAVGLGFAAANPLVLPDGGVVVGGIDGIVVAIGGGAERWRATLDAGVFSSAARGTDGSVIVATSIGTVYALHPETGATVWSVALGVPLGASSPAIDENGQIYVGSRNGRFYSVSASGAARWSQFASPAVIAGTAAIVPSGGAVVGGTDGTLLSVSAGGSVRWRIQLDGAISTSPVVFRDGALAVTTDRGLLYLLAADGGTLWSTRLATEPLTSPAVGADGALYVGSAGGEVYAVSSELEWFVPAVARAPGNEGTTWRSDLVLANSGTANLAVSVAYLPASADNGDVDGVSVTLSAGQTLVFDDVVASMFGLSQGSGGLRLSSASGDLVVTSRTYNDAATGTFGQGIPAFTPEAAIVLGDRGEIAGLTEDASYRSNLGFQNVGAATVAVTATLIDGGGVTLGTLNVSLPPFSQKQVNRPFRSFTGDAVVGGRAVVRVTSGGGVLAYGSVVDNRSGDPVYQAAIVR